MALSAAMSKLLQLGSGTPDVTPSAFELSMRSLVRQEIGWKNDAGAGVITAGTALAEIPLGSARQSSRLIKVELMPSAAVTANGTNYFSVILRKRATALPGTQVALVTFAVDTPTTDDLVAWAATELIARTGAVLGADAAFNFLVGDVLTLEITKTGGTGLSFPIGSIKASFEPRDL